ncbi:MULTISPECIES: HTH domain-containing protein [Pseudoalteromonas]|uniref:HTH domain-containing protein n=1 Tax=Pseudoalteromonas obscura TaxID=3048491 RepID=A0ABT7EE71_9GAMM|nr:MULTISPECIES: HTH domain-containing protein [Pseudoalteromonas]MBQ4838534.1 hypothetical protein [Pseudoalteromonas luteoviolacea]MDK2593578.1 HTH domain-containing protein [Pseudoalteromonas sp. P94(2023)]
MTNKPWKKAIIEVLKNSGVAMTRTEIAESIVSEGLREDVGSTPANTVVSYISTSMSKEGAKSPFLRVGRGEYALRELVESCSSAEPEKKQSKTEKSGAINAFGMFWSRDLVSWKNNPLLLGQQQLGATPVDMGQQFGIYILFDGRDVIYVGRSVDRPIGQRLYEHTQDRLRARWNRFSWFGIHEILENGTMDTERYHVAPDVFIAMLEAVLIEAMEPGQNRKRGDDFSGIEFIQTEDPEIEKNRKLAILSQMRTNLLS